MHWWTLQDQCQRQRRLRWWWCYTNNNNSNLSVDNKHRHLTLLVAARISARVKHLRRLKLWHIYVLYNDLLEHLTNDINTVLCRDLQQNTSKCKSLIMSTKTMSTIHPQSPVWGRGTPLPPCPFTSSSFPLSTFPFLSLALPTGWAKKTGPFFEVHNFFI